MADLIPIAEARKRVLEAVRPLPAESVQVAAALGRVLAESVESPISVPPFDSSAMDGYAVIAGPAAELELDGEARAGHPAGEAVREGTAISISTGAAVPEGATAVVPVEQTERTTQGVRVGESAEGANIRRAGEDIGAGETVLAAGTVLTPAALGVAASVGRGELSCARRPRVTLLVTGDELTDPGQPLPPGGIYSSNGYALAAQIESAGATTTAAERVPDRADATLASIGAALGESDVVVVSGGVSVGPHDHVKAAFAGNDVEERFWGVSLRPGKPTWFGTLGDKLVFGLPGNPVSAMVTFQLFVRPALAALQGADPAIARTTARLDEPVKRNPRREQAVRVTLTAGGDNWRAAPTRGAQGSHVLTSMLGANALALIPPGEGEAAAGELVEVELL
jgi:molybdopterin molybdotransferase